METYSLASGGCVYHFDTGPFNWYVISEGGRLTVVDAGFPGHYSIFRRGIQQLGYAEKDVAAILLTHAHADHMGFAERLRRASNAPVFVHTEDVQAAQRVLQLPWFGLLSNAWRPYVSGMLGHAALNGVFSFPRITQVRTFKDNAVLDVPGRPQVMHLPGHTPGEVAFYLPESSLLLSGDTIITRNLLTGVYGAPQVPAPILSHDYDTAHRSLDRLRDLGEVVVLPGHGRAWHGSMAAAVELARHSRVQ